MALWCWWWWYRKVSILICLLCCRQVTGDLQPRTALRAEQPHPPAWCGWRSARLLGPPDSSQPAVSTENCGAARPGPLDGQRAFGRARGSVPGRPVEENDLAARVLGMHWGTPTGTPPRRSIAATLTEPRRVAVAWRCVAGVRASCCPCGCTLLCAEGMWLAAAVPGRRFWPPFLAAVAARGITHT